MKYKSLIPGTTVDTVPVDQCFSTGGHGDLLKGSTRPVEMVHDLLFAELGSTEVLKYRDTATRYFFNTVISNDDAFKKCTIFDTATVVTFLTVLLHVLILFFNKLRAQNRKILASDAQLTLATSQMKNKP